MLIEVSVPGIRKDRGKLPAPTTLEPLRLAFPLAVGPLIWGKITDPGRSEAVTGGEVRELVGTGGCNVTATPARATAMPLLHALRTDTNVKESSRQVDFPSPIFTHHHLSILDTGWPLRQSAGGYQPVAFSRWARLPAPGGFGRPFRLSSKPITFRVMLRRIG